MVKIKMDVSEMSLAHALNAALDVAGYVKNTPVYFEYQGVEFVITMSGSLAIAPKINEPRCIADFDDEVLIDEYYKRVKVSNDFRVIAFKECEKHITEHFYAIFDPRN